jgi:hypothetical protein
MKSVRFIASSTRTLPNTDGGSLRVPAARSAREPPREPDAPAADSRSAPASTHTYIGDPTGISGKLNRIHHDINHISGGLVLRMTKHNLSREETKEWCTTLRRLADELEAIIK